MTHQDSLSTVHKTYVFHTRVYYVLNMYDKAAKCHGIVFSSRLLVPKRETLRQSK